MDVAVIILKGVCGLVLEKSRLSVRVEESVLLLGRLLEEEGCLESSCVSWKIIRCRHDSLPFCNIQLFFFLDP